MPVIYLALYLFYFNMLLYETDIYRFLIFLLIDKITADISIFLFDRYFSLRANIKNGLTVLFICTINISCDNILTEIIIMLFFIHRMRIKNIPTVMQI